MVQISVVKYEMNVMCLHGGFKRCTLLVIYINTLIFRQLIYCKVPFYLENIF